jgi:hypothetical protein
MGTPRKAGPRATVVSFGPNSGAKYITTYFRRAFVLADYAGFTSLDLRVMRDDGVVIYLNGTEVYRNNMPSGAPGYLTLASTSLGGVDEYTFVSSPVDPGGLVTGTNVIAAEIHQSSGGSSDISFDFGLTGVRSFLAPYLIVPPHSQTVAEGSPASLSVEAGGTAPLLYQWRLAGTNLPGATNATLTWPSAAPGTAVTTSWWSATWPAP